MRIVRFSGAALTEGIDVALEAMQEAWRAKRMSMDELWRLYHPAPGANVMRPYTESLS